MTIDIWEKFKWLWLSIVEMRKKSYPLAILGTRLIIYSLGALPLLNIVFYLKFPDGFIIKELQFSPDELSFYSIIMSIIAMFIGSILIYIDINNLHKQARQTAKVLIAGMLGTSKRFPMELLSHSEKKDARETIELNIPESENHTLLKQIEIYNAELAVRLYERFILHHDCNKVFLGGLSRVPFLVAYGACFRAVSAKVIYFDRFHRNGTWKLLDDEDEAIALTAYDINKVDVDSHGNVGLAVSFSTPILECHLPAFIRKNTIVVSPNTQTERNLVKNQENLHRISEQIQRIIDHLSSMRNCNKIHLFLSVQSTLALDIGKRYQEGIHKNWVIHNFNANKGMYDWAIELSKNGISEYPLGKYEEGGVLK